MSLKVAFTFDAGCSEPLTKERLASLEAFARAWLAGEIVSNVMSSHVVMHLVREDGTIAGVVRHEPNPETPYVVRERLGEYEREFRFATLEEMTAFAEKNGIGVQAQVNKADAIQEGALTLNEWRKSNNPPDNNAPRGGFF